jgi:hypothetical protein
MVCSLFEETIIILKLGSLKDIILRTVNFTWASTVNATPVHNLHHMNHTDYLVINNTIIVYGQECESRHIPRAI